MHSRQELARIALRAALDTRRQGKVAFDKPVCVYDLAEKLGLEVWFVGGASFGGIYAKGMDRLFVPAERPAGRRAFTCAHELAHWRFQHGSRVEELSFDQPDNDNPEEMLANLFAGYLLMPRRAVESAFQRRRLQPWSCSPTEIYGVACQLGVGYETLLKHLRWSLNLIDHSRMADYRAIPPKDIRRSILGSGCPGHLVIADPQWIEVAIDLEVGDVAVIPADTSVRGSAVRVVGDCPSGKIIRSIQPGLAQIIQENGPWAAMARVSRRQFTGRGAYRHLEDPDEDS